MPKTLRIVGLGGSLAAVSTSRAALKAALDGAADAGAETDLLDLRELDLPMYPPDEDEPTEAAARLIGARCSPDRRVRTRALYQGTIPGGLQNALDWPDGLGDRDPPYPDDRV